MTQTGIHDGETQGAQAATRRRVIVTVIIFALIAVLYIASIPGAFVVNPDSAFYLDLGRSIAHGEGYTINGEVYAKFPPVFPLALAAVYATAGESFWWLQFPGALFGVGTAVMTFVLLRLRVGWWPAVMLGVLAGVCGWVQSHSLLVIRGDVPYLCLSLVALWLAERQVRAERSRGWGWLLVALATWAAAYTHMSGAALVVGIVGGALLARGKSHGWRQRLLGALIVGVVSGGAVGFWLWRGAALRRSASYIAHVELLTGEHSHGTMFKFKLRLREWTATPIGLRYFDVPLAAAIVAWALLLVPGYVQAVRRHRGAPEVYLPVFLALSTVAGGPHGHERYVIPVVPLLLYYGYLSLRLWGRWVFLGRQGIDGASVCRRRLARAPVVLAGAYVLLFNLHARYDNRKALEKFSRGGIARARRIEAAWREVGGFVKRSVPKDARIYAASGGTWSVACFFFPERYIIEPLVHEMGPYALEAMLVRHARFVVHDMLPRSRERMEPLHRQYPGCFETVGKTRKVVLCRLDRAALATTVRALRKAGKLKPIAEPVRLFPEQE